MRYSTSGFDRKERSYWGHWFFLNIKLWFSVIRYLMTSLWRHKFIWNYMSMSNYVLVSFKVLWTLQLCILLWTNLRKKKKNNNRKNRTISRGVRAVALEHLIQILRRTVWIIQHQEWGQTVMCSLTEALQHNKVAKTVVCAALRQVSDLFVQCFILTFEGWIITYFICDCVFFSF